MDYQLKITLDDGSAPFEMGCATQTDAENFIFGQIRLDLNRTGEFRGRIELTRNV